MSCKAQVCKDARDSIGPDGECHAYDETLEQRFEALKKESTECAGSVKQMGIQIQQLMQKLQKEIESKDKLQNALNSQIELSNTYYAQRIELTTKVEDLTKKHTAL